MKNGVNPKYRFGSDEVEKEDHLRLGSKVLIHVVYKSIHDRVDQYLHWLICWQHEIKPVDKRYKHHPEALTEEGNVTIVWDFLLTQGQK